MPAITFTVQDATPAVIAGALVEILSSGRVVASYRSNTSGVVVLTLDAGTYTCRVTKPGYATNSASLTVSIAAAVTKTLTSLGLPAVPTLDTCELWGTALSVDGRELDVNVYEVRGSGWNQIADSGSDKEPLPTFVWGAPRIVRTSGGRWQVTVAVGSMIRVSIQDLKFEIEGIVPNLTTVHVQDLVRAQKSPPAGQTGDVASFNGAD